MLVVLMTFVLAGSAGPGGTLPPPATQAAASGPDPEAIAWVDRTLAGLDLRQRVAQLVIKWIPGGTIQESARLRDIRRAIESDQVGGLIVSSGPAEEFAPMLNRLQALAPIPLLIVSDLETGPGMRLRGGTDFPPAMAIGAAGRVDLARQAGAVAAAEARQAGIHMTLGPILDVNSNPSNPIINVRSFGDDPALVSQMASAWIEGAASGGLLTVGKHFPGHGATGIDSHVDLPTVQVGAAELESVHLEPYRAAVESGLSAILIGHLAVPTIDETPGRPASMSPAVIGGLVRRRLGFDGLVFTDALNMGAITENFSVAEASIQALLAGADALLQPPGEHQVIDAIVAAVEDGRIPRARIDEAARRMLLVKTEAGLHQGAAVRAEGGTAPAWHGAVADSIAAASVTLVRDRENLVPLAAGARRILHVAYSPRGDFVGRRFNGMLEAGGHAVEPVSVGEDASAATYDRLAQRAAAADLVILSVDLEPRQYGGALEASARFGAFAEAIIARGVPVVAVSFGSPYLLDSFPSVSTYLLAWSRSSRMQGAAARALLGQAAISGHLPVSLAPYHARGEGIERPL